jgi:peptidoglycan hydrolase-like protein with peptidoglycan-binding domain
MKMIAYLHLASENEFPDPAQIPQARCGKIGIRILSVLMGCAIAGLTQTAIAQTILKRGDSGQAVIELQNRLRQLGCFDGSSIGNFGPQTEQAVMLCQERFGIQADGIVGPETYNVLNLGTSGNNSVDSPQYGERLQLGDEGSSVQQFQSRLQTAGYYYGAIDGVFGRETQSAVIQLQQRYNLPQTGVADAEVYAVLNQGTPPTPSSPIRPGAVLKRGDRGARVRDLQRQLQRLGYKVQDDGFFGVDTESAVLQFQQRSFLSATGEADARTLSEIRQSADGITSFNARRYIVIIPIPNLSDLRRVLDAAPRAKPVTDRRGNYAEIDRYTTPEAAERIATNLRSQGFPDARVIFR